MPTYVTYRRMRVAILITSYNRRDLTLLALQKLSEQEQVDNLEVEIFLLDDGSQDGTAAAVTCFFPQVRLLHGDGSLFWVGGMRKVFAEALSGGFDAYILYNDDTLLYPDAVSRLVTTYAHVEQTIGLAIVVGSVMDANTGRLSYGGQVRKTRGLKLYFEPLAPDPEKLQACDTVNANFTLIPSAVAARLGNLDEAFRHCFADWDYGFRATKVGIPVLVAPGYFGTCSDNPRVGTWRDRSLPLAKRWRSLMSPKGVPMQEWLLYTRRHLGWRWPVYAVSPYLKTILGL